MTTPLTGDIKDRVEINKEGVTLSNFPQASVSNAKDKKAILNITSQSGKRLGAQVMLVSKSPTGVIDSAGVYIAAGNEPTSKWVLSTSVVGTAAATVTPA